MASSVSQINVQTQRFGTLFERVNELANVVSSEALTANADANGATVSGNSFLAGIFGSTVLAANTLRGGNVQSSGNLTVTSNATFESNVEITGQQLKIGSKTLSNSTVVGSLTKMNVDGTSAVEVDSFEFSSLLGQEYVFQVKNRNNNADTQLSKILVLHNQSNSMLTEYAQLYSNVSLASLTTNANSTHVRLYFTASVANTSLSMTKIPVYS